MHAHAVYLPPYNTLLIYSVALLPGVAHLHNIINTEPLELVCMNYLTPESSKGGYSNILVITDHFTKFAQAYPTKNQ